MDRYFKEWSDKISFVAQDDVSPIRLMNWLVQGLGIDADIRFLDVSSLPIIQAEQIESGLKRLVLREPISKILEQQEFYGRTFKTTKDTLDPRRDSETLIQAMLEHFSVDDAPKLIDFGTGTGCLLITLLLELPKATGVAVDKCPKALAIAHENAARHGLLDRIQFCKSDWTENVTGLYDGIISNPPYITSGYPLDSSVVCYDPAAALFGGEDGLDAYRSLFSQLKKHCHPKTKIIFEIGFDQFETVPLIGEKEGYILLDSHKDDGGILRALTFSCQ